MRTKLWIVPSSGSGKSYSASSCTEPGLWNVCDTWTSATWSRSVDVDAHLADLVAPRDRDVGPPIDEHPLRPGGLVPRRQQRQRGEYAQDPEPNARERHGHPLLVW